MKHAVLFFCLISVPAVLAQQPISKKTTPAKTQTKAVPKPKKVVAAAKTTPTPLSEKEQFEKASAFELAADRVAALEKFVIAFPQSENRAEATELLASSRVLIAEEKLLSGDTADAVAIYKIVIEQAPQPIPDDLFNESISKIPSALFFRGQRAAAIELAAAIESKVENNSAQLLEIANFHLATENGSEAMRVAAKAAAKDPASAAVQRTIALAHRINFDLDLSADAYAKSLELEPSSIASKRGLAEMKRALGRSDEGVALYRELLAKNETDLQSSTGLILALFDAGKRSEAESEMTKSLERTPGNVILLAGAAYWYASKGIGDKAVELAEKAIAKEPRYIWSYIALARGLTSQKKPVEAENVLVKARAYGNFPTLEYELASARMSAGFFREAAEDLQTQFTVTSSGNIKTNLGGRVAREEKGLGELVGFERKASIFTPAGADSTEAAETLKALLILQKRLQATPPDEGEVAAAADAFVAGSDKMKIHRQIYAASLMLQKRVALAKVLELTRAATGHTDIGLEVPNPRSAVMADELYEARSASFRRNEILLVPEIPAQTLSAIMRGRIEEIAGWVLYQQNNFPDAVVRLRRAISVMPDKSAWWRSSMWRLGAALAAEGKDAEALNSYIESYKTDKPDYAKYAVVEALYKKVNGNVDGLEAKLGSERVSASTAIQDAPPTSTPEPKVDAPVVTAVSETPAISGSQTPVPSVPVSDPPVTAPARSEEILKPGMPSRERIPETTTETPAKVERATINDPPTKPITKDAQPAPATEEPKPETKTGLTIVNDAPSTPVQPEVQIAPPIQEPKPETKIAEVKTEPAVDDPSTKTAPRDVPPTSAAGEPKPETRIPETKTEPVGQEPMQTVPARVKPQLEESVVKSSKPAAGKPLFEPIIITIPSYRKPAKPAADTTSSDASKSETKESASAAEPLIASGVARPRVIDGQEIKQDEIAPCKVGVSQENVSLINGGGNVGILVSVDAPGDAKNLTAISSSSKDIEITLEPEIGGLSDRRFYVIRSATPAVGVYQVTFSALCGKKDVIVTVR